jgi:hypothetical protein
MAYFLFRSSDTTTPFAIINEQTIDNTSSSISLVGKRRVDYGQSQQQNQLWLLENFAAPVQPSNPLAGQVWYDTSDAYLKVYNGNTFVKISNSFTAPTQPASPTQGQFWFDTNINKLNIYIGSNWITIGPDDSALPLAIVFGG